MCYPVVGFVATLATEPGEDAFRKLFRFYLQSAGDHLGEVVNFFAARGTGPDAPKVVRSQSSVSSVSEHNALRAGLQSVSKGRAYALQG
jgi:alkylated DNA repair protein alkB family protein 1